MKKKLFMAFGVGAMVLAGCSNETSTIKPTVVYHENTTPHYDVVNRNEPIELDGKAKDAVWESVGSIDGSFHFPWEAKEAPKTVFKAYHDETNFYFMFDVKDGEVLKEKDWKKDESSVDAEDRVELFFAGGAVDKPGDNGMEKYYAIEVDALGRVHDYSIEYYRDFDSKWNMNGLETKATTTEHGYIVEGKIPMKTLEELKLIHADNIMRTGVFRAEFSSGESAEEPLMEWISWVDPKTKNPDFHVNSAFGELRFLK